MNRTNQKLEYSFLRALGCLIFTGIAGCGGAGESDWKREVSAQLPILGHRNWIVIADSAYPSQTAPGIRTIYAGGDHLDVVEHVLDVIDRADHVRPVVYLDKELDSVPAEHAQGIGAIRKELQESLKDHHPRALLHEDIIAMLDTAGQTFHVLIIKTDLTLPYTSVFVQLDAGYWSSEAESELRDAMPR